MHGGYTASVPPCWLGSSRTGLLLCLTGRCPAAPQAALPFLYILPWLVWWLERVRPGAGAAVYIPSSLLRYVTFKLSVDLQQVHTARPPQPNSLIK